MPQTLRLNIRKAIFICFGTLVAVTLCVGIVQLVSVSKVKKESAAVHLVYGVIASLGIDVKNSVGIVAGELENFFTFDTRADWERGRLGLQTATDQAQQLLSLLEHLPEGHGDSILRLVNSLDRDLGELSRLAKSGHNRAIVANASRQRLFDFISRPGQHTLRQLDVLLGSRHSNGRGPDFAQRYYDMLHSISSGLTKLQSEVYLALIRHDIDMLRGHDAAYFDILRQVAMLERDPDAPRSHLPQDLRHEVEQLKSLTLDFYVAWRNLTDIGVKSRELTKNIFQYASELMEATEILRTRAFSDSEAGFTHIENALIALLAVLGLAGIVLAAMLYRRLARPLEKTAAYMRALAHEQDFPQPEKSGIAEVDALLEQVSLFVGNKEQQIADAIAGRQSAMRATVEARSDAAAKASLLSYMEKEVRIPLDGIMGLTALCLQTETTQKQREYLAKIQHASQSIIETVEILLDIQKLGSHRAALDCRPFSLPALLDSVRASFSPQVHEKGLALTCHVGTGVPETLEGDPKRIRQVLDIIVNNAVEHTDRGEIAISVDLAYDAGTYGTAQELEEVALRLHVRDTGTGLPDHIAKRLAKDRDEVGHSSLQVDAGPGLAVLSHIARLMRGKVWAESNPGKGTDFFVTFLCAVDGAVGGTEEQDHTAQNQNQAENHPQGRLDLQGFRILLVEDNTTHTEITKELLELYGLEVIAVTNGSDAIERVREASFDLVLMDIELPGMDGFAVTRSIRELGYAWTTNMPIVAVSAHVHEEKDSWMQAGMQDFMPKPVTIESLHILLERWLPGFDTSTPAQAIKPIPEGIMSTLDVALGLHHLNGNEQLYDKLLRRFADSNKDVCEEICASLKSGDSETAIRLAHTLKGVSASLGAPNLSAEAFTVEQMLKAGNFSEEALVPLEAELGKVLEAIEARLG